MQIAPFKLERFFARHEFNVKYVLSASDCEPLSLGELLELARPQTLRLWNDLKLGYTESQGHPALRAEIAGMYQTVRAEDVIVAVPEEAIFILMQALLSPGDHAVVLTPAYQSLYEVARGTGCEVSAWNLRLAEGGWTLDLDELKRLLTPRTRLLVLNFPHNPTGFLPAAEEFSELLSIVSSNGLYVLSDEMYRLLEHNAGSRLPAACDIYDKAVSLSGLSKTFGLPGLRTGWLATRDRTIIERLQTIKDYTTICHSAPSEILSIIALQAREALVERSRSLVGANLAAARAFFVGHAGRFEWIEPRGASVAFPLWKGPGTADELSQKLLRERSLLLVPGSLFNHPGNHFRVGLGRRNLPECLAQLDDFLQGL